MSAHATLVSIFTWVALPILGFMCLMAMKAKKLSELGLIVAVTLVASALVFMPAGQIATIGSAVGGAIVNLVTAGQ